MHSAKRSYGPQGTYAGQNGAGGAIRNSTENLTISACLISGNRSVSGGGIHNNSGGTVAVDCHF